MGLLDTSLQIGRSAIMAQSLAMDVVGNNIANASTEGYARQLADLKSATGVRTPQGPYLGLGVNAESIRRISDAYLEQRLRDARSGEQSLQAQDEMFQRLEGAFNELTDNDLSTVMNDFFSALNTLQSSPEETSVRRAVVESALTFTDSIRQLRGKLDELRTGLDSEVSGAVGTINDITSQIADLNVQIAQIEAGASNTGGASALRDRRDYLLGQLCDLIEVRVVDTGHGMVNVFAGADPLVMDNRSYDLATETRVDRDVSVTDIVFAADGRAVNIKGGKLEGLITARDTGVTEFVDELDKWAGAFIEGFNRIHSSGTGLEAFSDVTGANGVDDPAAVLSAAGLDFSPETGTFDIAVQNSASGQSQTFRIHVDLDGYNGDDTTLASLVADINAAVSAYYPQVTASIGPGNTLRIASSTPELTFTFANDSSGALAALGVNTFFTGSGSSDIEVNALVQDDPGHIAAGLTSLEGDNSNVSRLLAFQRDPLDSLGGSSVDSYYQGIVATLGVRAASASDRHTGAQAITSAVQSQREAVSGVSLDEEAVKLIRYQSGYAAAARFISTVNNLLQVLLNM